MFGEKIVINFILFMRCPSKFSVACFAVIFRFNIKIYALLFSLFGVDFYMLYDDVLLLLILLFSCLSLCKVTPSFVNIVNI